ncbi:PadR family transcriptional regulator [Microbacterium esteraromaticum]|uniref:PadR family transcriptional regulator n=1 Tax=Microbacterium esteraromaticum TaxID=57043 RepID=A0A939DT17_9MICO|nr:PadR family transcriptional regulator [Microbacterium esteraromaticum]MBN8414780.1 PadR family transcriptional regulator [Microbacterium esteraromaticum]MBN8424946.1 PadR family transcriptional regulator [Microbacterium esteraromaticum]
MTDSTERIATNLRKGVLEFCVLGLLANTERYGLELAGELQSRGLIAGEGSLYPLLSRMREGGLVATRTEAVGGGRPRKYYAITETGRAQLCAFASVWRALGAEVDSILGGNHEH